MASISVIIPSNHDHNDLLGIVRALCTQKVKPYEIVIVDSSRFGGDCPAEITKLCMGYGLKLIYKYRMRALPGDARNIGLRVATGELIAFIDVQTIPRREWLEASLSLLSSSGAYGVWGATSFIAQTRFERLVRDGFYGVQPRRTLPGSIFRREVFDKSGQFIDWVRAGEDTEWMLRLELLRFPIVCSSGALVDYVGLRGMNINQLLKKWYRNYYSARALPHFFPQKLLLWLVLYPLLVVIAFNWNYLISDWRMDSPLYIGHVTKIVAIMPAFIYVILRGLVLPFQRGIGIWRLLPARFLAIATVCLMADLVRVFVFSLMKRK